MVYNTVEEQKALGILGPAQLHLLEVQLRQNGILYAEWQPAGQAGSTFGCTAGRAGSTAGRAHSVTKQDPTCLDTCVQWLERSQ